MADIVHLLIGDGNSFTDAAVKTSALFLTATVVFRLTTRRPVAEFAPFDWIAAVATGAIVGRAATATDTSWLAANRGVEQSIAHAQWPGAAPVHTRDPETHRSAVARTDPGRKRRPSQPSTMRPYHRGSAGRAAPARTVQCQQRPLGGFRSKGSYLDSACECRGLHCPPRPEPHRHPLPPSRHRYPRPANAIRGPWRRQIQVRPPPQ